MSILDYGKARANKMAGNNILRLTDTCDCNEVIPVCRDTVSFADSANVNGITVNGESMLFAVPIAGTNTVKLAAAIESILNSMEVNCILNVTHASSTTTVVHVGAYELDLVLSSGSTSAARTCLTETYCDYKSTIIGDNLTLVIDGTEVDTLSELTWGDASANTTAAGTAKTEIEGYLGDNSTPFTSVSVTPNNITESYDVVINAPAGLTITIGEKTLIECNCALIFIEGA